MKKLLPSLLASFITGLLFAQDVRLNDSVIFINDKPVALYSKSLSNSPNRYNMEVYGFDDYVLIKAEVIKFKAPVPELKPFYYYELTFPPTADTFAMYIEEEAFPLTLAKIIRDYNLISKNELNKKSVSRFISNYYGGPALTAKIRSFEDYLNETRYFNEQEKRDRTKPVTIINNRIIIQDGVKIGFIAEYQNANSGNHTYQVPTVVNDSSGAHVAQRALNDEVVNTSNETEITLYNGRRVDNQGYYQARSREKRTGKAGVAKDDDERDLYQLSKAANKRIGASTDYLLMKVCAMIEDYVL